jgi:hypothetical protein
MKLSFRPVSDHGYYYKLNLVEIVYEYGWIEGFPTIVILNLITVV